MDRKNGISLIGIILILSIIFFTNSSRSEIQDEFNDTATTKTIGQNGVWYSIVYIKLPKTATITNAILNITGINFTSSDVIFNQYNITYINDTYGDGANPTNTRHTQASFYAGKSSGSTDYRGFIQFNINITDIKSLVINATLRLKDIGGGDPSTGTTIYLYNITSSWSEETLTYNNQPSIGSVVDSKSMSALSALQYNFSVNRNDIIGQIENGRGFALDTLDGAGHQAEFQSENGGGASSPQLFIYYNATYYPSNVTIDISNDGDVEFNHTGALSTKNTTSSFASEITTYLSTCTADTGGFCYMPVNISCTNGQVTIDSMNITLTESPRVNITYPINDTTYDAHITSLNYTAYDLNLNTCWYSVNNGATNTTITCGQNVTGIAPVEGSINWTLWVNDTDNNVSFHKVTFTVSLTAPTTVLNSPPYEAFFNRLSNIYLNYTSSDPNGISECQVWHNLTGTFHKNSTNLGVTSGQMNYTVVTAPNDGGWLWNVWCNDTTGLGKFSGSNFTFTTDTTYPYILQEDISVTTPTGSQTITFNVTDYTELNCNNSFYSVYDSGGLIENSIENISLTSCSELNSTFIVAETPPTSFNLVVYMRDKAGNENSTTKSFTTVQSPGGGGGGGGGGGSTETIPVIALQTINSSEFYSELERAIIYTEINNYCSVKKQNEALALTDLSGQCQLTTQDLDPLLLEFEEYDFELSEGDLRLFIENYKNRLLEQVFIDKNDVERFNLFSSVLGITTLLQISPPSLDKFFTIYKPDAGNITISYTFVSNKPLKSCDVVSETPDLTCEINNLTIKIYYKIPRTDFSTRIFSGTLSVTTDAEPDKVEQKRVQITMRVINLGNSTIIGGGIVLSILVVSFVVYNSRRKHKSNKLKELLKI